MNFKDSNFTGCYAEQLFSAECIKRNIPILFPVLDSSIYDCVIDINNEMLKIQIKSTEKIPIDGDPNINVPLENGVKQRYNIFLIDYFAIWSKYYDGFFIFPNTGNMSAVRISKTGLRKHQFNNFNFTKDSRYSQLSIF